MKTNKVNEILINQIPFKIKKGQKSNMNTAYDYFMENLIEKIRKYDADKITDMFIDMIHEGELEQVSGNFYKYKDFHILELFKKDGADYSNKLKTLSALNLKITQRYIETVEKDESVFIVTRISGTENKNLTPLWKFGIQNISKENRIRAFKDLQKLTKAGFTDDKISRSIERWYVNSDKKIVIPTFEYLRPINPEESQKEIIEKYYNILFK